MHLNLHGKRAYVCGSTQGIGRAAAERLAAAGASITLIARNEDALQQVRTSLPTEAGQSHRHLVADFTDPSTLAERVPADLEAAGPVHILVNNTGGPPPGPAFEATADQYLDAFQQHLICNHLLATRVTPGMRDSGYGRIINVISTSVRQPIKGLGVSNTVRGAVASWAKTLAGELGPWGVTVNNVLPGFTATARLDSIIAGKAKKADSDAQAIADQMKEEVPLRRFAEPEEVAAAVVFLASPEAAYISGVSLPVDGGRLECL